MPTAAPPQPSPTPARSFLLRGAACSLAVFGLLRLPWIEAHLLLPIAQAQGRLSEMAFGAPAVPIAVTLACSGADVLAICIGAILAYPAAWRVRLAGATGGVAVILALNTVRIGTLGRAAASPAFEFLHLFAWPALLMVAAAAYVFWWMQGADAPIAPAPLASLTARPVAPGWRDAGWRFAGWTVATVAIFTAASPLYLESPAVLGFATLIAGAAAVILGGLGVESVAAANLLSTPGGAYLVTEECVSTPLLPVYIAGIVAFVRPWRARAAAVASIVPLLAAVGIARLLVVALPGSLTVSPAVAIHGFSQVLTGVVVVVTAALLRHGAGGTAAGRALAGLAAGSVFVLILGAGYGGILHAAFSSSAPLPDPQGALAFFAPFQAGLYLALAVVIARRDRHSALAAGFAVLAGTQVAAVTALHLLARYAGLVPDARGVRAWAVLVPVAVIAAIALDRPRRGPRPL